MDSYTRTHPHTRLSDAMDFGHVVHVDEHGLVTHPAWGIAAPEVVYVDLDTDGRMTELTGDPVTAEWADWRCITWGMSGQDRYDGPIMHESETIGGRLAEHILSTPGYYVAVIVDGLLYPTDEQDDQYPDPLPVGWAVARYTDGDD